MFRVPRNGTEQIFEIPAERGTGTELLLNGRGTRERNRNKFFLPITGRNFGFFFIPIPEIPEIPNSVIRNLDFENSDSEFREFSEFPQFYFCIFFRLIIQISFIFTKIFPRTVVLKGDGELIENP